MRDTAKALRWIVGILNKHNISYQISGGFAAKLYGSPRELNDIDIEISEKNFSFILPDISQYITYGPERYKDDKWDCELITLNYEGQEIDISGADTLFISNKERTKWLSFASTDFNPRNMVFEGIEIKVSPPEELTRYKSELDGDHQTVDINAVKGYIINI